MKSLVRRLSRQNTVVTFNSRNFPQQLRAMIESGELTLPEKKLLPRAVVGCVDLEAIETEDVLAIWTTKQNFFERARELATQHGLVILNQNGDGMTFLANYFENANWTVSLMNFQDAVQKEFKVRLGVSMGATAVGYGNQDPATFTALGPEVDLAVRLCRQAAPNQMIVSTRVWYSLSETLNGWSSTKTHFKVRGFKRIIPCMALESEESLFQQAA